MPVRSCLFLRAELAVLVRDHGRALVFERHEVVVVLLFGEGAYLRLFLFCHGCSPPLPLLVSMRRIAADYSSFEKCVKKL